MPNSNWSRKREKKITKRVTHLYKLIQKPPICLLLFASNQVEEALWVWEEKESGRCFFKKQLRVPLKRTTMEVPKDQIATLLEHGLYSSAQMLVTYSCSFPSLKFFFLHLKFDSPPKKWLLFDFCVDGLILKLLLLLLFWTGLFSRFFTCCKCWILPTPQNWELGLCKFPLFIFIFCSNFWS